MYYSKQFIILFMSAFFLTILSCSNPDKELRNTVIKGYKGKYPPVEKMYFINSTTLRDTVLETSVNDDYIQATNQYLNNIKSKYLEYGILMFCPNLYYSEVEKIIENTIEKFCKKNNIDFFVGDFGPSGTDVGAYSESGIYLVSRYESKKSND